MTPRILLLLENQSTGGVTTITQTLYQALRQHGWPITQLTLSLSGWLRRLTMAARCDVILASHNFGPAYVAWVLGLVWRKPVVVWVHGPLLEVLAQAQASPLKRGWLRWLYRRVPQFVFVSRASRDSFERFMQVPLRPHQRGIIILNAVAPMHQAEDTSPPSNAVPTNPQLAYIGRFSQEKQPYLLLDMLRLLPARFHLTLIGDGPLADPLRQAGADLLACARLTLVGPQAHGPRMYAPWHLTLLASRYEGCPMSLLESFSAGVPCVGFPIAALQEIVGEDAPYLLAHDHSAQALTDAVQNILARPRSQVQADMARILSRHQLKDFIQSWQTVLLQMTMPC